MGHDLSAVASEIQRKAGGDQTLRPLVYGDPTCGEDPHFEMVFELCRPSPDPLAFEGAYDAKRAYLADQVAPLLGEEPATLDFVPFLWEFGFPACNILGPGDQLLAVVAVSDTYGAPTGYEPTFLAPTARLGCVVLDAAPEGDGPHRVGACVEAGLEGFYHDGFGADAYALLPGTGIDESIAQGFLGAILEQDTDGDGVLDAFDEDLDGDGIPDVVDHDDDGDGVLDDGDWSPRDVSFWLSPATEAALRVMLAGERTIR